MSARKPVTSFHPTNSCAFVCELINNRSLPRTYCYSHNTMSMFRLLMRYSHLPPIICVQASDELFSFTSNNICIQASAALFSFSILLGLQQYLHSLFGGSLPLFLLLHFITHCHTMRTNFLVGMYDSSQYIPYFKSPVNHLYVRACP